MFKARIARITLLAWVAVLMIAATSSIAPRKAFASETLYEVMAADVYSTPRDASSTQTLHRSWYGDELVFSISAATPLRYFDGSNVGIEVRAECPLGGTFSVGLYRNSNLIGIASLNRNGFSRAEWTGVGPGSYYFVFSKAADGAKITCSNVAMFSW